MILLEIFFLHTYSLFIVYSFPQKNAHKNATGFETKREHWYHLGLVFCSMLLSFICCYYGITSVFKAMQCLFYCKKVWCSAKLRYYFFVCVCCVLHCPPHPSVRPDKKKSFYVFVLLFRMLWYFELMKIACLVQKDTREEERMQVGFTWHFAI